MDRPIVKHVCNDASCQLPVETKKFFGAIGFLLILVFEHFDFVGRPEVVADVVAHVVGVGVFVALTVVTFRRLFDAQI